MTKLFEFRSNLGREDTYDALNHSADITTEFFLLRFRMTTGMSRPGEMMERLEYGT